jgi:hypothetical protein
MLAGRLVVPAAVRDSGGMAQPMHTPSRTVEGGGWLTFAAVLFLLAAAFNAVYGVAALANDDYFAADELLFGDLSLWGVLYLAFAAVQLCAAVLIIRRNVGGAVIGIGLAGFHALTSLVAIGAYPVWSVIMLIIDGLIIYGLTVYGLVED